jgi:hypothetical protein
MFIAIFIVKIHMNFEKQSNEYLLQLISDGTIVDSNLISVNEQKETAKAIASFNFNDVISEKIIFIYKNNNVLNWKFLNTLDNLYLNYSINDENWDFNNFSKRIVAPSNLVMEDVGIKMLGWFQLNNLPVVTKNNEVFLYCNVILPQHQQIIDDLSGLIRIEDKP